MTNEAQQISALQLIDDLSVTPWRKTLNRLFKEGSAFVQEKILSMAEESPEIIPDAELLTIISAQGALATKALVIAGKRHMAEAIPAMTNCLENPEFHPPEIRAAAATAILLMDDGPQALAQSTLEKMLTDGDEASNIIALNMLVDVPWMLDDAKLSTFLLSDSIKIRDTALQVAEKRSSLKLISYLW